MGVSRPQKAANGVSTRWVYVFCIASFFLGVVVINRFWAIPDPLDRDKVSPEKHRSEEASFQTGDILSQVSQTHDVIMTLDKTISSLEMQLAAARAAKGDTEEASPIVTKLGTENLKARRKVFFVMGIITAFSSRKRRDSIRETWMPKGDGLLKLENEKGIIMRFVIGHSATAGGVLDRAIDAEDEQHKDFLRLNHIEGYHELSSKTQIYFSTAVAKWDADFYIKVDDDVHVNLGMVGSTLARHRSKPRVYIGCMKSGPVLGQKGVKYHEPEYWKFGEEGNKYFRHATGQIYAISKDLATYISVNRHILHRYANEDVSLGSWFIGLDVEHIDDRSLCCGTAPVAYASQWSEWERYTSGVVRAMKQSGIQVSETCLPSSGCKIFAYVMIKTVVKEQKLPDFCLLMPRGQIVGT
ncbi:Beta-1,6-galactosyltransferase GALT31A [Citrus sinensis]|uniref:Beta-1,6-galactosyltransferase GALT31A n=1 Tax=Citrus sinensis TaxID=2711 RepID=A0ACB8LN65_CITSI|nr:Beta-1,6-galactosyltransferase GALT31A [Citrus sinensis]